MDFTEKPLKQDYLYRGKIVNLRVDNAELPDGTTALREVIEHPGGVCVAALTEKEELLFVEQFRYPYMETVLELPAGKLEYGEDPFEAGKRELLEETGAAAENYRDLGKLYPTPGYCGEIIHMYLAENLTFSEQHLDEDEFLELYRTPFSDMLARVMRGEIEDAKTVCGILKVHALRTAQKERQEKEN